MRLREGSLLDNLLYSLNASIPVFIVIVAGWFFRQKGMLTEQFVTVANKFNFKVTLPILLFMDISSMNLREVFHWQFVLFCMVATTICFFVTWIFAKGFLSSEMVGSFVQGSFRGSAAVLGVAFMTNIYGDAGLAPLMIIGCVPLYNIYSVIVLTIESNEDKPKQGQIKTALVNICKNPLIIGILLGVIVALLPFQLPDMVNKTLSSFSDMATPLALIAIGAAFEGKKALAKIRPTLVASLIKLVVQPLVFLSIAVWLGFRNQELIAFLIMLGAPSTASSYIMAKNMGNDDVLSASIIVVTTLLSAITITGWLFLLKSLSLIA